VPRLLSIGRKAAVMLKETFVFSEVDFVKEKLKPGFFVSLWDFVQGLKGCFKVLAR